MSVRVMSWNIRQGGGGRQDRIVAVVRALAPDLVVLTEYRTNPGLRAALAEAGWGHQHAAECPPKVNSTLVAARSPVTAGELTGVGSVEHRWLHVVSDELGCDVLGVYFKGVAPKRPVAGERAEWHSMVAALVDRFEVLSTRPALVIGDFNTGGLLDSTHGFFNGEDYERYLAGGWVDAFRRFSPGERRYSWWNASSGRGFRLDHAFVSPALAPRLLSAELVDEVDGLLLHRHPDAEGRAISDHAALLVELADPGE